MVGVTQDFEKIRNLQITSGRYFDGEDFLAHFKVCLITDHMAQTAFGLDPAVGNNHSARTVCVAPSLEPSKKGVPTFGQSEIQEDTLLIPFPLVKSITGENFFQVLYAQAASSGEVSDLTRQMNRLLQSRHRKEARYTVENLSSLIADGK